MKKSRILIVLAVGAMIAAYFWFDLDRYLDFDYLKAQQTALGDMVAAQPTSAGAIYFFIYVIVTALSLPGAAVLTLIGGAIFGLWKALFIVSFASTIGATLAFLLSRYLFRDWVTARFGTRLAAINRGIERDGAFYLFTLRLVPLFPFFVINLLMGLTPIAAWTFLIISQIGMLPGTFVFVNAGTQLGLLNSPGDVLSPALLLSFAALGLFPLVANWVVQWIKRRRIYQPYARPKRFDYNVIVIGAGSGGLVSAYIAAATRAKVALVEKNLMGGDCLNFGCVPSKALLKSAKAAHDARRASEFGLAIPDVTIRFDQVMDRVHNVIDQIAPHDSVERYSELGVECLSGEAFIKSPYEVTVGDKTMTTRSIIVATGASPFVPAIPGLSDIEYLTSDNLWQIRDLPEKLTILGGGPIGCELALAFTRLGSKVTIIEMAPRLILREDPLVSAAMASSLIANGVTVQLCTRAIAIATSGDDRQVICEAVDDPKNERIEVGFDQLIVAVGRRAHVSGFGLEELGVTLNDNGTIATNSYLATDFPNIYAVGDVAGPYQFTHTASHQAWYATVNSLFGGLKRFAADYEVIPWCTFTDPEIARVGLNETEAEEQNIDYELTSYGIDELDRAIADSANEGFVRVLTVPGSDKILGVTIVGPHAGELIAEFVLAMRHGLGLKKILGTIHIYPTLNEANKYVAGNWQRAHTPTWMFNVLQWFHRWRRGGD